MWRVSGWDGQTAILHQPDLLGLACDGGVTGDQDEGQPEFLPEDLKQADDLVAGVFVDVAGGLGGEQRRGFLD